MRHREYLPLDPECPGNPVTQDFFDDPITEASGCGAEIAEHLESKHRAACARCQEYGAEGR
jgi:hypothetical protein